LSTTERRTGAREEENVHFDEINGGIIRLDIRVEASSYVRHTNSDVDTIFGIYDTSQRPAAEKMHCIGTRTNLSRAIVAMPHHIIERLSVTATGIVNAGSLQTSVIVAYLRKVTRPIVQNLVDWRAMQRAVDFVWGEIF
jgi:hypothetical protein